MMIVEYGIGGFDPEQPNNNIVAEHDDGQDHVLPPLTDAYATIDAVRDPGTPTPTVEDRLAAIEALLLPPGVESGA